MPKTTILIPTFDHADTLFHSVASAQAQTRQDFEILIVGDGVPEHARDVVAALARRDARIRFFDFPKGPRHGEIHRHKVLSEHARGDFVCYLTDDDLWFPEHLETLEGALAHHDLAHTMEFGAALDSSVNTWFFQANDPNEVDRMRRRVTGIGLATLGHTMDAYRRLPFGWRTTPEEFATDCYMALQFLDQPWLRSASLPHGTVVHLGSPIRSHMTPADRLAELAVWTARIADPRQRLDITRQAVGPCILQLTGQRLRLEKSVAAMHDCIGQAPSAADQPILDLTCGARPYAFGETLSFGDPAAAGYLCRGFYNAEAWGAWSCDNTACVVLPLADSIAADATLVVHHHVLLRPNGSLGPRIELIVNGIPTARWTAMTGDITRRVPLRIEEMRGVRCLFLEFRIDTLVRPTDLGLVGDNRPLGIGIVSLRIEPPTALSIPSHAA